MDNLTNRTERDQGEILPLSSEIKESLPNGFFLNQKGVWFKPKPIKEGDMPQPIYICSPLMVKAIVRDQAHENHGRLLEFPDVDGHMHSWPMPMEMLAGDGTRYREELLNKGLSIASGRIPREYLAQYIQQSQPQARAKCVLQTGWIGDSFVLPKETIGPVQEERYLFQSLHGHLFNYDHQGDYEKWRELAHLCQGNSRLILAMSAAFAAPLLSLLGEENGGFHFRGSSSIGKTTALIVAASVWGGKEFLQRWRATANGLEGMAAAYNDALLCLDEIEQMHPTEIGEVAYMLANGVGKVRSDKNGCARRRLLWRLLFLSTGEISLAAHIEQGGKKVRAGQEVRILDIPADTRFGLFESLHGYSCGASFAEHLIQLSREHYGHAIRLFLKAVIEHRAELLGEIRNIRDKLKKRELPRADGQVKRAFNRFSLVAAAGELATMYGITGWSIGEADRGVMRCFHSWMEARGGTGPQEEREILAQVRRFFEQHGESRFTSWHADLSEHKTINRAGFKKCETEGIEFFVFPETFKSEIAKGFNSTLVAQVCLHHKLLRAGSSGDPTRSERLPGMAKSTRVYRFTSSVLTE